MSILPYRFPLLLCVFTASACASAGARRNDSSSCALLPSDSTLAAGSPVYGECEVEQPAKLLTPSVPIPFEAVGFGCDYAAVRVVVDSSGAPEVDRARVVRTNNRRFASAVVSALRGWRFSPAVRNGQPTRQVVVVRRSQTTEAAMLVSGRAALPVAHTRVGTGC